MKISRILFGTSLALILIVSTVTQGFSQAQPASNRIPQQIIVNGRPANGAYVRNAAGGMQSYRCPNPQSYTTPDGASSGWACYDQPTATYLLNALPAAQPQTQAPPQQAPPPQTQPQPQPPARVYSPSPYSPYPGYRYPPRVSMGQVKIDTKIKNGSVYVDGAYAGITGKLKKFLLAAGNYDIELRDSAGQTVLKEHVQVMAGRTVELKPAG